MPKTHEILNGKRKGHPNFPCPGPKIVQWVKKKPFANQFRQHGFQTDWRKVKSNPS